MALKATFPAGSTSTTVMGIYQWDYGRELEIEALDLGSEIVEIHFACSNMNEAIVRACTFTDGVGKVTIPDICLEQASAITAWIYQIRGSEGYTAKTIILPITSRTRPSANREIPTEVSDKYTELITEVNEAYGKLESGEIVVAEAKNATNAVHSTSAGNASSANFATTAGTANKLASDWFRKNTTGGQHIGIQLTAGKTYIIAFVYSGVAYTVSLLYTGNITYSSSAGLKGYHCSYGPSNSTLSFSDSTGAYITVTAYYIREI